MNHAPGSLSAAKLKLLAARLRDQGIVGEAQPAIPRREDSSWAPLSDSQTSLWFLQQLDPQSAVYNVPGATRMRGALDVAALEAALNEIIRRHESLRTKFTLRGGLPIQAITAHERQRLQLIELDTLPAAEGIAEAVRLATEESRRPFDLAREFAFRCFLVRLAADEHVLVVNLHHVISDGWSMAVFTRELFAVYAAFAAGQPSPLAELPIQYGDVTAWQQATLTEAALAPLVEYWRTQLASAPAVLPVPTDKPRPPVQACNGRHEQLAIDPALSESIRQFARERGATAFEVLLAAYHVLLYGWTGATDQVVGTPMANRTQSLVEGLIGYFVNIVPLRVQLDPAQRFDGLLRQVRDVMSAAEERQSLPFGKLVERLQLPRISGSNPVFQVSFTLFSPAHNPAIYGYGFGAPLDHTLELAGLQLSPLGFDCGITKFDLSVLLWDTPTQIAGTIEYDTDLFLPGTIVQLAERYQSLLGNVVANADARLCDLA